VAAGESWPASREDSVAPAAYAPRLTRAWITADLSAAHRVVEGSLVLFDITGFTRLTERLASRGREGAEELSEILHGVFGQLLAESDDEGADLLKWGGDAVLLLLDGPDHARRAGRAALRMHRTLTRMGRLTTSIGRVALGASTGVDSGQVHLVLAGNPSLHRELVVLGPTATRVTMLERAASTGQVLVGETTAAEIGARAVGVRKDSGHPLTAMPTRADFVRPLQPDTGPVVAALLLPPQLRIHLAESLLEPEHRTVATAFLRFDGTDALLAGGGPDALTSAVDELIRNIQEATATHEVSFHETDVDIDGGKIMLVAGAPRSAGDDTDRLLGTVRRAVDRAGRLPLRAGVAHGRVFTGDLGFASRRTYSVKGDAVNLAARLASHARPGSVLLAADVLDHTRRVYTVTDVPAPSLKGRRTQVHTVALGHTVERRTQLEPADLLVGRDGELATLEDAIGQLSSGNGAVVEVVGEPGIGKSRLVDEAAARAVGVAVVRCDCERTGAGTPYTPVRRMLHHVLGISSADDSADVAVRLRERVAAAAPDLLPWLSMLGVVLDVNLPTGSEVADLEERYRAERAAALVADLLEQTMTGISMLVVEDAHLADPASARVLTAVSARVDRQPWLVLVTREDQSSGWVPTSAARIELGPLAPVAAIVLAEIGTPEHPLPPAVAEAVAARSGGHPLLVRELATAAARGEHLDELPSTVEELAAVQMDRFPASVRFALRRAAVLGNDFDTDLLLAMLEGHDHDEPLPVLLARLSDVLVADRGRRLRFRHPLLREAAYASLPYRRRRELHARAATILESTTKAASRRPEILALHYFVAGRYDLAWRYARRAGKRAGARYAPAAAAEAYARAAEAARRCPEIGAAERSVDLEALGDALFLAGNSTAAVDAYREALRTGRGDHLREAHLALKQARVEQRRGRYAMALRRASLGMHALDGVDGPAAGAARARLQARYAVCRVSQGRYADARRWAQRAIDQASAAGELDALAQAHLVLHTVETWSAGPEGEQHGQAALRLFEELGDLGGQAHALNNLALRRLFEARWSDALVMYTRAAEMFRRVGDATNAANADYNRADVLVRQGRFDEASPLLEESLRVARAVGDEELVALVLKEQGRARSRAGEPDEGLALLVRARTRLIDLGEPHEVVDTEIAIAEAHALAGRHQQALAMIEHALKQAAALRTATLLPSAHRVHAAALFAGGALEPARAALAEGLRHSDEPGLGHERGFLLAIAARIARLDSDPDAERLDNEASAALHSLGVVQAPLPHVVG
jgi:class 3 adenylate cyclase/tetratricopeptide (TPR) repeat protein